MPKVPTLYYVIYVVFLSNKQYLIIRDIAYYL
jgi:hypothetical protein